MDCANELNTMKKIVILFALLFADLASARTVTTLKLMSYNIRGTGHTGDTGELVWDIRKEASIAMIARERPDVIGFQEPKNEQVTWLTEHLPDYAHVSAGRDQGVSSEGEHLPVMWLREKYDLVDWGYYWLSETPGEVSRGWDAKNRRITVWVCLRDKVSGGKFYYFNTHLDHKGHEARRRGALLNVEMMRKIAGKRTPAFISGDMNAEIGQKTGEYLKAYTAWLESAHDAAPESDDRPSFNGFGKSRARTLDYIYFRRARALRYETLDSEAYGVRYVSDHYPIVCTFVF